MIKGLNKNGAVHERHFAIFHFWPPPPPPPTRKLPIRPTNSNHRPNHINMGKVHRLFTAWGVVLCLFSGPSATDKKNLLKICESCWWLLGGGETQEISKYTLPETKIASENGWLEYDRFLLGCPSFKCYVRVRECIEYSIWNMHVPKELLQIAAEGGVDLKSAVTRRFSMDQVNPGTLNGVWGDVKGQMVDITQNDTFNVHPPKI